jgi:hypothetical protein
LFSSSFSHSNSVDANLSRDPSSLLLVISLVSVPGLAVIVAAQSAMHHLEQLGVGSEEVFRGDRLPLLPFPDHS